MLLNMLIALFEKDRTMHTVPSRVGTTCYDEAYGRERVFGS